MSLPLLSGEPVTGAAAATAGFLVSLSMTYSALSFRWERAHRAIHQCTEPAEYQNMLSSWSFCAAIVLPVKLVACVIIVAAIAEWPARNVIGRAPAYRYVYSAAAALLASEAAHWCTAFPLPLAVATGALVYLTVSLSGIALAMLAVGQRAAAIAFLKPTTHRIEFATITIAIAAIALLHSPWPVFAWLSLPATVALERHAVRTDLHSVAELRSVDDPAVRPMNSEAWLLIAREVIAACTVGAVMRVDTADPAAVSYLARVQAGCDAIGMAGDSGLAVLLTECPAPNAEALAVRLRSVLHRQGIPAQVAVAAKPRDGQSLDDLLAVSEAELIARVAATREARSDSPEA